MLIVVLLVGTVVFVVRSSFADRSGYDARSSSRQRRSRHRSGTVPPGDGNRPEGAQPEAAGQPEDAQSSQLDTDTLIPGLGPVPPPAATGTETPFGDDVTALHSAAGEGAPVEPRRRRPETDADETRWTEPPTTPPPVAAPPPDAATLIVGSPASRTPPPRPEPGAGRERVPVPGPEPEYGWDDDTATRVHGSSSPDAGDLVADEPATATAPALRLAAAGRTRRGKRGGPNEDAFVVADGLLAVADGVGGEAAGQIASTLAVTTVAQFRPQYAGDPRDGLRRAVERANKVVREKPKEQPNWRGMACTLDVVVLGRRQETANMLTVAHVGDSSVWLQPSKGLPRKLTTPHAIKNGPLLNAVGLADEIEADLLSEPVQAGDRVVLASDGITKVMSPEALDSLMNELGTEPPERAADALVEAAMLAGARDDTTIVVADLVPDNTTR
jgi:serine/threonine protein phosphatase PrpC